MIAGRARPDQAHHRRFIPGRGSAWAGGIASALCYGVTPIVAIKAFADGVSPSVLVTLRGLVGAAALLGFCALTRRLWRIPFGPAMGLLAVCGPLFGAQILAYFAAMERTGAQLAVIVAHVYPVFVIALVWLQTRKAVSRGVMLVCVMLSVGISLVAGGAGGGASPLGIGLALLSAAGYAVYFVCGERWVHRVGAITAAGLVTLGSAVSVGLFAVLTGANFAIDANGWVAVTAQGLILIPIGIGGALNAIRHLGPVPMSLLGLLEPVAAILLAALLLGERLTAPQWVGVAVVLAACAALPWVTREDRTPRRRGPTIPRWVTVIQENINTRR